MLTRGGLAVRGGLLTRGGVLTRGGLAVPEALARWPLLTAPAAGAELAGLELVVLARVEPRAQPAEPPSGADLPPAGGSGSGGAARPPPLPASGQCLARLPPLAKAPPEPPEPPGPPAGVPPVPAP